ncbi:MAG: DUF5107 domain-containing protein [Agriterribacter sp.]
MKVSTDSINGITILIAENDYLKCIIVPALGGKLLSVYNKELQKEFLWTNQHLPLVVNEPGAEYDPNFLGGIDELIPNDIPENIDGIDYPDHGELWTTPLDYVIKDNTIILSGVLPLSQLYYSKTIKLDIASPTIHLAYTIRNQSASIKHFLWKLHAALAIEKNDTLITSASKAKVVDAAYSRFSDTNEFGWPTIEQTNASIVPEKNNSMDFFFLYDTPVAEMAMRSSNDHHEFRYTYDKNIFPYQWYFASYGGFLDHYTAILEPSTAMPLSVNDAKALNQCSVLQPNEEVRTTVQIYAGINQTVMPS